MSTSRETQPREPTFGARPHCLLDGDETDHPLHRSATELEVLAETCSAPSVTDLGAALPARLPMGSSPVVTLPASSAVPAYEQPLFDLLTAPHRSDGSIKAAHDDRQAAIECLFSELSVVEARALLARLSAMDTSADPLATSFRRLKADRQERLLAYLAATPRRLAIAMARRR